MPITFSWDGVGTPSAFTWTPPSYPAGPNAWNAQPNAVAPPASYFTPYIKPPAEVFNYMFAQIATDLTSLQAQISAVANSATFTANGTWTCPAGVYSAIVVGCGGGGGGEGGYAGNSNGLATSNVYVQGAGGAGAPLSVQVIATVPGQAYAVTIGAGGAGGAAGAYPNGSTTGGAAGGYGSPSQLNAGGINAFWFPGASGGGNGPLGQAYMGAAWSYPASAVILEPGGSGPAGAPAPMPFPFVLAYHGPTVPIFGMVPNSLPGAGGGVSCTYANQGQSSQAGNISAVGNFPGGAGTTGTVSSTYAGGSGGGGGGGGSYPSQGNSGGNGGNGGNGNNAGTGGNATAGTAGVANTGGGGGGGGSGGFGSSGGGTGGAGGAGASGFLNIYWIKPGA